MARRRKVFGIPIGKRKPSMVPRVIAAGAGLAAVPAVLAARRSDAVSAGMGKVSAGIGKVKQVSDIADKAQQVAGAMSEHGTTIGKIFTAAREIGRVTGGDKAKSPKLAHLIEEHTDVAVPRSVAYNQWTQFELFPTIVKGAERVEQKGRDKVEWTAKIGPSHRTWQGQISEQVPDERIAFESKGGLDLKGVVTFHSLGDELTRVHVELEYAPRGAVEHVGNVLRVQRRRVRRDLRLFKHFVELRGEETGAWRSRIAKKKEDGTSSGSPRTRARRPAPEASTGRSGARSGGASRPPAKRTATSRAGGTSAQANGTRSKSTATSRPRPARATAPARDRTKSGTASNGTRSKAKGASKASSATRSRAG